MYGYTDSSEVGPGKSGGKFGLNSGALITKFEYNPNGGKAGAEQDAIDFTAQIGEKEYRLRFFPVGKIYAKKNGGELTDVNSDEYKARHKEEADLLSATLTDIVKVFVPEEDIKLALSTNIASFKDYAQILERLVKSNPNWNKTPADIFLQYQYSPSGDNPVTYLELPKNVKHGQFIAKSLPGEVFVENRTATSLKYNSGDVQHPFKRNEWFIASDFAKQTGIGANAETGTSTSNVASGQTW